MVWWGECTHMRSPLNQPGTSNASIQLGPKWNTDPMLPLETNHPHHIQSFLFPLPQKNLQILQFNSNQLKKKGGHLKRDAYSSPLWNSETQCISVLRRSTFRRNWIDTISVQLVGGGRGFLPSNMNKLLMLQPTNGMEDPGPRLYRCGCNTYQGD